MKLFIIKRMVALYKGYVCKLFTKKNDWRIPEKTFQNVVGETKL